MSYAEDTPASESFKNLLEASSYVEDDHRMPDAKELVSDLKRWAAEAGKNQSDIARLLNIDRQRVSDWFTGNKIPTLEHGLKILQLLKGKHRK